MDSDAYFIGAVYSYILMKYFSSCKFSSASHSKSFAGPAFPLSPQGDASFLCLDVTLHGPDVLVWSGLVFVFNIPSEGEIQLNSGYFVIQVVWMILFGQVLFVCFFPHLGFLHILGLVAAQYTEYYM